MIYLHMKMAKEERMLRTNDKKTEKVSDIWTAVFSAGKAKGIGFYDA